MNTRKVRYNGKAFSVSIRGNKGIWSKVGKRWLILVSQGSFWDVFRALISKRPVSIWIIDWVQKSIKISRMIVFLIGRKGKIQIYIIIISNISNTTTIFFSITNTRNIAIVSHNTKTRTVTIFNLIPAFTRTTIKAMFWKFGLTTRKGNKRMMIW